MRPQHQQQSSATHVRGICNLLEDLLATASSELVWLKSFAAAHRGCIECVSRVNMSVHMHRVMVLLH